MCSIFNFISKDMVYKQTNIILATSKCSRMYFKLTVLQCNILCFMFLKVIQPHTSLMIKINLFLILPKILVLHIFLGDKLSKRNLLSKKKKDFSKHFKFVALSIISNLMKHRKKKLTFTKKKPLQYSSISSTFFIFSKSTLT